MMTYVISLGDTGFRVRGIGIDKNTTFLAAGFRRCCSCWTASNETDDMDLILWTHQEMCSRCLLRNAQSMSVGRACNCARFLWRLSYMSQAFNIFSQCDSEGRGLKGMAPDFKAE